MESEVIDDEGTMGTVWSVTAARDCRRSNGWLTGPEPQ